MEPANELVPDIGNPPKVRQKRAPKHDFKDGNGRVFAHRHDNGGGWVADTAYAAPTVEVKRYAQVWGAARVLGNCRLESHARVFDQARLYDNVVVKDTATVCGAASVRDRTTIVGNAFVSGSADLSGSTRVGGNVTVAGFAKLINTNCSNSASHRRQLLDDHVFVTDSHIYEICTLRGTSVLYNTTLRNVMVSGTSRLAGTTLHTQLSFEAHQRLYTKDGAEQHPLHTCVTHFCDVQVLNGRIIMPPVFVNGNNVFIDCDITLQPENAQPDLFQTPNTVYYVRINARRVANLFGLSATAMDNIRNNRPANPDANAQTYVSPILNAGSQRRILRLEGAT